MYFSLMGEEGVVLVEKGHAVGCQNPDDFGLVLGDELVQDTFPVLIGMAHPHSDSIYHARSGRFLDERRDLHRDLGVLREIAGDRAPKDGGIDAAGASNRVSTTSG